MKRLTIRNSDGSVSQPTHSTFEKVFNRLAEYEDIELSPKEIRATLNNFSTFLWHMTNGRMSKTNYTVETMRSEADNCMMETCNECEYRDFAEKYEKAKAEGRMIVLPCNVGDVVYKVIGNTIYELRVIAIPIIVKTGAIRLSVTTTNHMGAAVSVEEQDLGKTVFCTREEAEDAIKAQQEGNSNT